MALLLDSPWKGLLPAGGDDRETLDLKLQRLEQLSAAKERRLDEIRRNPGAQRPLKPQQWAATDCARPTPAGAAAPPAEIAASQKAADETANAAPVPARRPQSRASSLLHSHQQRKHSGRARKASATSRSQPRQQRAPLPARLAALVGTADISQHKPKPEPPPQAHAEAQRETWRAGGIRQRIQQALHGSKPDGRGGKQPPASKRSAAPDGHGHEAADARPRQQKQQRQTEHAAPHHDLKPPRECSGELHAAAAAAAPQPAARDAFTTPPRAGERQRRQQPLQLQPQRPHECQQQQHQQPQHRHQQQLQQPQQPQRDADAAWRNAKRAKTATGQQRTPLLDRRSAASNASDDFLDDIMPTTTRKRPAPMPAPRSAFPKLSFAAAAAADGAADGVGTDGGGRRSPELAAAGEQQLDEAAAGQQQRSPPTAAEAAAAAGDGNDGLNAVPARPPPTATPWRRRKSSLDVPPTVVPQQQPEADPQSRVADAAVAAQSPAADGVAARAPASEVYGDNMPDTQPALERGFDAKAPPQEPVPESQPTQLPDTEPSRFPYTEPPPARQRRSAAQRCSASVRHSAAAASGEPAAAAQDLAGAQWLGDSSAAAAAAEAETQPALSQELPLPATVERLVERPAGSGPAALHSPSAAGAEQAAHAVEASSPADAGSPGPVEAVAAGPASRQRAPPQHAAATASMQMVFGPTEWQQPLPPPSGLLVICETPADAAVDAAQPDSNGLETSDDLVEPSSDDGQLLQPPCQQWQLEMQPPCSKAHAPATELLPEASLGRDVDAAAAAQQLLVIELTVSADGRFVAALAANPATGQHHVQLWTAEQAAAGEQQPPCSSCAVVLADNLGRETALQHSSAGPRLQILPSRLGDTNAAAVVALASGCGRPIELSDGAHRAGVWLLQLHPADSGAAATAHLLATPTHANCVLAPGDGCLYAGGVDGSVRCWQLAAGARPTASPAAWTELPALLSGSAGGSGSKSGVAEHLWLASRVPLLLAARLGGGHIIFWNLQRREQLVDTMLDACSTFHAVLPPRSIASRQVLLGIAHHKPFAASQDGYPVTGRRLTTCILSNNRAKQCQVLPLQDVTHFAVHESLCIAAVDGGAVHVWDTKQNVRAARVLRTESDSAVIAMCLLPSADTLLLAHAGAGMSALPLPRQ